MEGWLLAMKTIRGYRTKTSPVVYLMYGRLATFHENDREGYRTKTSPVTYPTYGRWATFHENNKGVQNTNKPSGVSNVWKVGYFP